VAEAENYFRRALELNANYARAHEWYAYLLSSENRHDEAIQAVERAERLDPNSPSLTAMAGILLYAGRRYDEAYSRIHRSLELQPDYYLALQGLGWICPYLGKLEEAVAGSRRAVEISDALSFNKFSLAMALISAGELEEARKIAVEIEDRRRKTPVPAHYLAVIYANLGEKDTAFRWLDEAIAERGYWTLWMRVEPRLDGLREDARFAERLEKLKPLGDGKTTADFISPPTGEIGMPRKFKDRTAIASVAAALICLIFVGLVVNFKYGFWGKNDSPQKIAISQKDRFPNENPATIAPTDEKNEKPRTTDNVANELYLSGKQQLETRTDDGVNKAIQFFTEAAERDPNFALAFSGLADAHILLAGKQENPAPAYRKAEEYAVKAITLDPDLAEARISLGMAKFRNTRDFAAAEKHFLRAIEIKPSLAAAHHWYFHVLNEVGKTDDALREREIAARLEPGSALNQLSLARLYMYTKRYDEAIVHFDKAIENDNSFVAAYYWKSLVQQFQGEYEASLDTYRRVRIFSGDDENEPFWLLMQAQAHASKGRRDEAQRFVNRYLQSPPYRKKPEAFPHEVALVYNLLGETEKAFAWLEKVKIKSAEQTKFHSEDPRFANLHNNPRFVALTQRWQAKN
jgi:serine/threonine-protein kinase